jgi:hypothetical protein
MMQRHFFNVSTDTGTYGDTGPAFFGSIMQMRWNPTTADTGADLAISLLPKMGDTGDGWLIFNDNDCLGADFVRAPRQSMHGADGAPDPADTGAAFGVPIASAGDRLRIKVTPGGAAVAGRLYIWTQD